MHTHEHCIACCAAVGRGGFFRTAHERDSDLLFSQKSCFKAPDGGAITTEVLLDFKKTRLAHDAMRLRLPTMHPEDVTLRSKVTGTRQEVMLAIL